MRPHPWALTSTLFCTIFFLCGCSITDPDELYESFAAHSQFVGVSPDRLETIFYSAPMPPDELYAVISNLSEDRWNWDADERYSTYDPFYACLVFKTAEGFIVKMEGSLGGLDNRDETFIILSSNLPGYHFDLLTEQVLEAIKSYSAKAN